MKRKPALLALLLCIAVLLSGCGGSDNSGSSGQTNAPTKAPSPSASAEPAETPAQESRKRPVRTKAAGITFTVGSDGIASIASVKDLKEFDGSDLPAELTVGTETYKIDAYTVVDGVLFSADLTQLIRYPENKEEEAYTVPDGTQEIGELAFSGVKSLKSVTLPDGLKKIGETAFSGCENLETVLVSGNRQTDGTGSPDEPAEFDPASVESDSVGKYAFNGCEKLSTVELPNGLKRIEFGAFYHCDSLESILLPDSLRRIDSSIIDSNKMKSIVLPRNLQYIAEGALEDCLNLECVTLPATGIPFIQTGRNFSREVRYLYPDGCTVYAERDNMVLSADGTILMAVYEDETLESWTVPEGVTEIADGALYGYANLKKVTLPEGLVRIGNSAFEKCEALAEVNFPDGLEEIGDRAFAGCKSLAFGLKLPEGLKTLGWAAFDGCSGIPSVILPDSLKEIRTWAFLNCTSLANIRLPEGIESIGSDAFSNCPLTTVSIHGNGSAKVDGFSECPELVSVEMTGVSRIENYAFKECKKLTDVQWPEEGMVRIGEKAFYNCGSLRSVVVHGNGEAVIEEDAFRDCYGLIHVELYGVSEIKKSAFAYCEKLSELTLSEGLVSVGANAFDCCAVLYDVVFPEGLARLGNYAFSGTKIVPDLPASLTEIGTGALPDENIAKASRYMKRMREGSITMLEENSGFEGKLVISTISRNSLVKEDREDYFRKQCSDELYSRLAGSFEEADTLIVIHWDYSDAGTYVGGFKRTATITRMAVFDLKADTCYDCFVCQDTPPNVIDIYRDSTTGAFKPEEAIRIIEAAIR